MNQDSLLHKNEQTFTASFQQKSTAVSLVVIAIVAMNYFVRAYELAQTGADVPAGALGLVIGTAVFITVVEIVLQIVLVIGAGGAEKARSSTATIRAAQNAYYAVIVGIFATVGSLFWGVTPFVMANIALLSFVVAELVRLASQLIYWRK